MTVLYWALGVLALVFLFRRRSPTVSTDVSVAPAQSSPTFLEDEAEARSASHPLELVDNDVSQTSALTIGDYYSRAEIHSHLGGGMQEFLPHVDGRVVCGCFNPGLNPDAPDIVLPGFGVGIERWADVFARQRGYVPCFLKRDTSLWEYVGNYRVREQARETALIATHAQLADRDDVSSLLFLEREE
ncbi:MAG: DUF6697 family protein [Gemmatimonadaceae bacterium]